MKVYVIFGKKEDAARHARAVADLIQNPTYTLSAVNGNWDMERLLEKGIAMRSGDGKNVRLFYDGGSETNFDGNMTGPLFVSYDTSAALDMYIAACNGFQVSDLNSRAKAAVL